MKNLLLFFLFSLCIATANAQGKSSKFIKVKGTQFWLNNKPYYFMGTNFWPAMNLGVNNPKSRARLKQELDSLQALGITNLRIMALVEGPNKSPYRISPANNFNGLLSNPILQGLDYALNEMKKRKMYAVVCLNNFWPWSGGMAQYLKWAKAIDSIPYPMDKGNSWDNYMDQTTLFYSHPETLNKFNQVVKKIINRTNSLTNKLYKNDETIMAWELCNEPRAIKNQTDYLRWIDNTSALIKSLDTNHLVTVGSEGLTPSDSYNNNAFTEAHSFKNIDYTCIHVWAVNWGWYNHNNHDSTFEQSKQIAKDYIYNHVQLSKKINKPLVLEEFGFARNGGSYDAASSTAYRDEFYDFIFKEVYDHCYNGEVGGVNFWAWSGQGKPNKPGSWWKEGDDFTGDPPHEEQGWNSVYNSDTTTKAVIKKWAEKIVQLIR